MQDLSKVVESIVREIVSEKKDKGDKMTLSLAEKIADAVEKEAARIGVNAVVAVSNEGARPVLVHSMDDAYIASYDIALNKAYTVVSLKMSTSKLKALSQPERDLYGIQFTNNGQIVIFGGGEPLKYNGKVIGGLGVSGGSEEQDTYLAAFGKEFFEKNLVK